MWRNYNKAQTFTEKQIQSNYWRAHVAQFENLK